MNLKEVLIIDQLLCHQEYLVLIQNFQFDLNHNSNSNTLKPASLLGSVHYILQ